MIFLGESVLCNLNILAKEQVSQGHPLPPLVTDAVYSDGGSQQILGFNNTIFPSIVWNHIKNLSQLSSFPSCVLPIFIHIGVNKLQFKGLDVIWCTLLPLLFKLSSTSKLQPSRKMTGIQNQFLWSLNSQSTHTEMIS